MRPPGPADPIEPAYTPTVEAIDAVAIEAALELTSHEPADPLSLLDACEGLRDSWRDDSGGWWEMPLPSATPMSGTAVLHSGMRVPWPQPLEMRITSVDVRRDVRRIAGGRRLVEAGMRERAAQQRASLGIDSFLPMERLPAFGEMGSGFGMPVHPVTRYWSQHNGADITGDTGDPVVAVLDGEVVSVQSCPFYGNTVVVYHGAGLSTVHAHLDSFAVGLDDEVKAGQLLGAMGSTRRTTGPHLHFEARVDGAAVGPARLLLVP